MMRALIALAAALALASSARAATPAGQALIDTGLLQGVVGEDAIAFKDIPYAAPPVGALRWRPPQPAVAWTGIRDASAFGPACPQAPGIGLPAGVAQSEDCLTLNVWTPLHGKGLAPVMVWLHGGGDDAGTAAQAQFDGSVFARDGVVFVSLDYRLGALGWFAHPALTREAGPYAPLANYGLMDEIAALKWVRRNIRALGGDPARVTVAGESAGGQAVLLLMTAPAANGLFARAIVESGTGWTPFPTLAEAEQAGVATAVRAGAPGDADAGVLRALPVAALVAANQGAGPIVDGRLVEREPARVFAAGVAAPVPLLIGSNSGEDRLLGDSDPKDQLKAFAPDRLAALRAAYGTETPDDDSLGRALFRDQFMGAPARWIAARQAANAPAYLYQFAYVPTVRRLRTTEAGHGVEMLFVFEALDRAPIPLRIVSDPDRAETTLVHGCWAAFVKTGRPDCPGGPAWPVYTPKSDALMLFGDTAQVQTGFRKAEYDILDAIEAERLKP